MSANNNLIDSNPNANDPTALRRAELFSLPES